MLRRVMSVAVLSGALALPFASGCNETVSEDSKVKVKDNGTVIKESEKVTRDSDGNLTKTETRSVDKPGEHDVKVKVDKD
jgi:hypothetical protein